MSRPPDLRKRADLLADVTSYLVRHGVADLSLRPLAAELGTSSRMLIYYFGTKEALIGQALAAARPDLDRLLADIDTAEDLREAAWDMWVEVSRGSQVQSMQVLLQLLGLAVVEPSPYAPLAREVLHAWLDPISASLQGLGRSHDEAERDATLLVSGMRGLCNDLLVTHQRQRIDRAAATLIDHVLEP